MSLRGFSACYVELSLDFKVVNDVSSQRALSLIIYARLFDSQISKSCFAKGRQVRGLINNHLHLQGRKYQDALAANVLDASMKIYCIIRSTVTWIKAICKQLTKHSKLYTLHFGMNGMRSSWKMSWYNNHKMCLLLCRQNLTEILNQEPITACAFNSKAWNGIN